jgi:predicted MPP superfamily phosphohydrolase
MPPIMANLSAALSWAGIVVAAVGAVCVAYGVLIERRWYRRRTYRLQILPPGAAALSILHLSDLHFVRADHRKATFLRGLPPADVTVVTGDLLGEPAAVEIVAAALRDVRGRLASYFVLGSNDYFAPRPLNYANYFRKERRRRIGIRGRGRDLVALLEADGWIHLKNRKDSVVLDGTRLEVLGLDDPHIERHDLRVAPRADPTAVGLAVVHSPDPAPELVALGYQLIVTGPTHGGQVRLPVVGALVTNSDIPTRLAMGLSRLGPALMHVSPGLGTGKFAPFRFLCRPEATVLELVPHSDEAADGPAGIDSRARENTRS